MAIEADHNNSPGRGDEQPAPAYEPPTVDELAAPDGPAVTAPGVIHVTSYESAPRNI